MTDEATTNPVVDESTPVVDDADGMAPKPLRDALKREQAKTAKLTTQLMASAYKDAGLDPEAGLGKAIAKEYEGEPTKEALLEYAESEYGYKPELDPENNNAAVIEKGTEQLERVQTASTSSDPLTDSEALTKATAEGNLDVAGAIKAKRLRSLLAP